MIFLCHVRELFDVLLIVALLSRAKSSNETFGLIFMFIVDELEVHVDKHRVEDEGQLVPVHVQRVLNQDLQVPGYLS